MSGIVAYPSETVVYTDGGCDLKDRGVGSWAYLAILPDGSMEECCDGMWGTTNNRMEMMAVLKAFERMELGEPLVIVSDSEYVIKGLTLWHPAWIERGWKTYEGKPVKNRDLWERLIALLGLHMTKFKHVKGHMGDWGNERVDTLCTDTIKRLRSERLAGHGFEIDPAGPSFLAA
jgi:ribonuclease HI